MAISPIGSAFTGLLLPDLCMAAIFKSIMCTCNKKRITLWVLIRILEMKVQGVNPEWE